MRALTLHRPWPWAILHLDERRAKRTENRSWPPPASLIGHYIALHAGQTWDERGAEFIAGVIGRSPPPEPEHPLGIVGVARIGGVRAPSDPEPSRRANRWYMGRFGWRLGGVVAIREPVPCRGSHRIWSVPEDVAALVLAQLPEEVRKSC